MIVEESIETPLRNSVTHDQRWDGPDKGLVWCWELGRMKAAEAPEVAAMAVAGHLVPLLWKGGIEKTLKFKKHGSLNYLAMWQGLRGENLLINTAIEVPLKCAASGSLVVFTNDTSKYAEP